MTRTMPHPVLLILTVALVLVGCREGNLPTEDDPAAPESLEELFSWAYQRLLTPVEPEPVPERSTGGTVPAAGPRRLAALLEKAEIECGWRVPDKGAEPLVEIRERSYAQPGSEATAGVQQLEGGRRYRCLTLERLGVDGRSVGSIWLQADFGNAQEFILIWSRAGQMTWPITRPGQPTTFEIPTAQLSDWDRHIGSLLIGVPDLEGNDIQVEELALLPQGSAFPEPVGRGRWMIRRHLRGVIYAHNPATVVFRNLKLPAEGRFATGLAVTGAGVARFRVVLRAGPDEHEILSQELTDADAWVEANVALGRWAGRTADLVLATEGPAGSVALWGDPQLYEPVANGPRVLVYLIDTLGATHMSLHSYRRDTTPNLDALAARGTWFANAFSNASRTVESIPNMMLSMPTVSHGVQEEFGRVPGGLFLLAESFSRAGYATACFSTNVNAGPRQGLDRGFEDFFDHFAYFWSQDTTRTVPIEEVTEWMLRHRDRPIFVYVHTAEPHSPYIAPEPFTNRYDPDYAGPITGSHTDPIRGFQQARSPRDIEHVVALYDAEVAYADHRFGQFMSRLAELGLDQRLLTVVTSDHGEQFLEHGLWKHGGDVHGELIRVPLIIAGPAALVPSGRVETAVQLQDLWPTLLDLCGLPPPGRMFGDSLRPLMQGRGEGQFAGRAIFASTFQPNPEHHALIRMPWKLMFKPVKGEARASFLLFNIVDDPAEQQDVLDREPEVAGELIREMVRTRAAYPRYVEASGTQQRTLLDREHLERLIELGYIEDPAGKEKGAPISP
ncbi:MAG: sulfatase [Phycisphaerales bacterium]|nr:MAG: sulfatase [Phycisphaerales bacterium]